MLVVVSGSFTLAFGADFTFQISGLGLSKCHSTLTPVSDPGFREIRGSPLAMGFPRHPPSPVFGFASVELRRLPQAGFWCVDKEHRG